MSTGNTKCIGEGCPIKGQCWRHTAPESRMRETIFARTPGAPSHVLPGAWACPYFVKQGK